MIFNVVMRSDGTLKLILNVRISDTTEPKCHSSLDRAVIFCSSDGTLQSTNMLKVSYVCF